MFEGFTKIFKKMNRLEEKKDKEINKDTAKERLHLVLMQDRANVSSDFLDMMRAEIVEVIKKYVDVDENEIDVKLTNKQNSDGTVGAPALYANIPIRSIKQETRKFSNADYFDKSIDEINQQKLEDTKTIGIKDIESENKEDKGIKTEKITENISVINISNNISKDSDKSAKEDIRKIDETEEKNNTKNGETNNIDDSQKIVQELIGTEAEEDKLLDEVLKESSEEKKEDNLNVSIDKKDINIIDSSSDEKDNNSLVDNFINEIKSDNDIQDIIDLKEEQDTENIELDFMNSDSEKNKEKETNTIKNEETTIVLSSGYDIFEDDKKTKKKKTVKPTIKRSAQRKSNKNKLKKNTNKK